MSLPSQSGRNARSSSVHYRRSRTSKTRRLLPAVLVVGALALILWFALRPTSDASPDISPDTSNAQLASANAQDTQQDTQENPTTIQNNAPPRALPGSGNRPNTQQEVKETIDSTRPPLRTIPTNPTNPTSPAPSTTPSTNNPATTTPSTSSSLLNATRNQTNTPSTSTNPSTNRPVGTDRVRLQLDTAQRMVDQNDRVAARQLLSQTLNTPNLSPRDAQRLRDELTKINEVLLFGPVVAPGDPITEEYTIQSGDSLSRIAARRELATHWKLIQRVNRISNPSRIRLGQTLKLIRGPFHAIVYKKEHRLDLYHGSPSDPANWIFIRSMSVGLGADNGTPIGTFTISTNKLQNPGWVNPRDPTERYAPNDPKNPIGEYWLGFDGVGQYAPLTGYGIHGTIDPASIGDDQSMGCVRLADGDIDLVYELLVERVSIVEIRP